MKIDVDGNRGISKSAFVKAYIFEHDEAYVSELYRAWKQFRIASHQTYGTVASIRQLIKHMKDDGLIVLSRIEEVPGEPHLFPRHYYKLTRKAYNEGI
jgi:hypothetical protein